MIFQNLIKIKMKKIIGILLLFGFLLSCSSDIKQTTKPIKYVHWDNTSNLFIVVIDSCEYIGYNGYEVHFTHKGNCKFCEERRKNELENLKK